MHKSFSLPNLDLWLFVFLHGPYSRIDVHLFIWWLLAFDRNGLFAEYWELALFVFLIILTIKGSCMSLRVFIWNWVIDLFLQGYQFRLRAWLLFALTTITFQSGLITKDLQLLQGWHFLWVKAIASWFPLCKYWRFTPDEHHPLAFWYSLKVNDLLFWVLIEKLVVWLFPLNIAPRLIFRQFSSH